MNFLKKWQELLPKHHRVARNYVEQFSDDLRGFKIASSKFCFTFAAFGDHLNVVDEMFLAYQEGVVRENREYGLAG